MHFWTIKKRNAMRTAFYLLPAFGTLFLLVVFPIFYNLWESIHVEKFGRRFLVWFQNYKELMLEPQFTKSLTTTILYASIDSVGSFLLGLIVAIICTSRFPGLKGIKVLFTLPWVIPYIIVGVVWSWILHPMGGIMPNILKSLHLDPGLFSLVNSDTALSGVLLATIWRGFPFAAMMLLASLQSIDEQLYEAATIDGASKWQVLTRITLPIISPVIAIVITLRLIWSANQFDTIFMMTGGGPENATQTAALYIYRTSFEYFNTSKGAAASFIQLAIFLLLSLPYIMRTRKELND